MLQLFPISVHQNCHLELESKVMLHPRELSGGLVGFGQGGLGGVSGWITELHQIVK